MSNKFAVRLPNAIKRRMRVEARMRLLDESDIVREALREYFERRPEQSSVPSLPIDPKAQVAA